MLGQDLCCGAWPDGMNAVCLHGLMGFMLWCRSSTTCGRASPPSRTSAGRLSFRKFAVSCGLGFRVGQDLGFRVGQAELQEICGKLCLRLAGGDGLGEGKVWRGRGLQDESAMWNNLGSVLRVFGFSISGV